MARSSVALSIIFTISVIVVNCQNTIFPMNSQLCTDLRGSCSKDKDCCTHFCAKTFFLFNGICSDPKTLVKTKRFETNAIYYGSCAYNNNTSIIESNELFKHFGVSVAHKTLAPYTKVMVEYENKNIIATINNRIPENSQTLLQLSDIAAKALGIRNGGNVDCNFIVENKFFMSRLIYGIMAYIDF
ncbi:RlpA-like protein, double-psi beta-barrel domain [Cinara cedri]|uniref:RlpA-like protein, double-psi beta-barrel domain n=1 Tax=Cinara cedri TaxID=506608 RepID=A0A5E4MHT7_9HEMI|nr:RlpA-like protein, double-psi beta-barrel domain [Cinara cedri]